MRILCDSHIPFVVEAVLHAWPEVDIFPMESELIDASAARDADILIVRTRTLVNEELLAGSSVRMVCTATIGYDHIDTHYCETHGIQWMSCPGCNAQAVCDYIEEALDEFINYQSPVINTPTLGIVGVGHVGSLVAQMATRRGMHVLLNDPPKGIGVSLDEIAQNSDIITFHVPLDHTTRHMCDAAFLAQCKPNALIINAARGGVVDEQALLRSSHPFIIDTWENEPDVNPEILRHAFRASMHIAGYSIEGKRNATQMCLDAIADRYHLPKIVLPANESSENEGDIAPGWLARITRQLQADPASFETLRKQYRLR